MHGSNTKRKGIHCNKILSPFEVKYSKTRTKAQVNGFNSIPFCDKSKNIIHNMPFSDWMPWLVSGVPFHPLSLLERDKFPGRTPWHTWLECPWSTGYTCEEQRNPRGVATASANSPRFLLHGSARLFADKSARSKKADSGDSVAKQSQGT